jgi:hypothetical protein
MVGIWKPGRRLFTAAAILMLLTAVGHTLGQFAPPEGGELAIIKAMSNYHIDLGLGMRPSFFDIFRTLAFVMSVMFTGLGLLNLIIAADPDVSPRLLRRITWGNLVWLTGFTAICLIYRIPPPLIFGLATMGILAGSLIVNRKR